MEFDLQRPCSTKSRAPNRYTKEELKKMLQDLAQSGAGGSALMGVKESIDKAVRPTDAKLADDLTKDFTDLSGVQDPAKIKEIATRMAGKL